jgi:hypothetical protein
MAENWDMPLVRKGRFSQGPATKCTALLRGGAHGVIQDRVGLELAKALSGH